MHATTLVRQHTNAVSGERATVAVSKGLAYSALSVAVYGLGGLGVVGLTRLLAEALQPHFLRVATTETRGIAQRRAPVRSMVRAGSEVRSATIPPSSINLAVVLEASEALRAAPLLHPGTRCLHADLVIPCSGGRAQREALPDVGSIRSLLVSRGIEVIPIDIASWLRSHVMNDVLVSTAAFGALAALIGLPTEKCEQMLLGRLAGKLRDENQAAFRFGVQHIDPSEQGRQVSPQHASDHFSFQLGLTPLSA